MSYDDVLAQHETEFGDFYMSPRTTFVLRCKHCNHQVAGPFYDTQKAIAAAQLRAENLTCKNITCPRNAGE